MTTSYFLLYKVDHFLFLVKEISATKNRRFQKMRARDDLLKAVRQALYHISRGNPIPASNRLLYSPLVLDYLRRLKLPDTPEARQEAIILIFKDLVNEYGLEQPEGRRQQEVHKRIFDLLLHLLRGQFRNLDIPRRSYDRYHAQAVRILAEKFRQKEEALSQNSANPSPKLEEARKKAREIVRWLQSNKSVIDLLALSDLEQVATIIENYDYPSEAEQYFSQILKSLEEAPNNMVVLSLKARVSNKLAHCLMNQGQARKSTNYFNNVVNLATEIRDWELLVHGMHMLGVTYNMVGDWYSSLAYLRKSLKYATRVRNYQQRVAWIYRDMIASLITKRDFVDIPSLAKRSLSVRESLSEYQGCMMTLEIWGRALIAQERFGEAELRLLEALSLVNSVSSKLFHTILYVTLAHLYKSWRKLDKFDEYATKARQIALQHGLLHQLSRLEDISRQGAT